MNTTTRTLGPFRLASGETVIDRSPSHVLTGHPEAVPFLERALQKINAQGRTLIEETVEMGETTGSSACVETGGDDETIFYAQRPGRGGRTRFVKNVSPYQVTTLVVSASWESAQGCYILETAYAGEVAPPEPYDEDAFARRADPEVCRREAYAFWTTHALTASTVPWLEGTETAQCPWSEPPP